MATFPADPKVGDVFIDASGREFVFISQNHWRWTSTSPLLAFADLPCSHRGESMGTAPCQQCGGVKHEPVATCDLHGHCSMRSVRFNGKRIAACLKCADAKP